MYLRVVFNSLIKFVRGKTTKHTRKKTKRSKTKISSIKKRPKKYFKPKYLNSVKSKINPITHRYLHVHSYQVTNICTPAHTQHAQENKGAPLIM